MNKFILFTLLSLLISCGEGYRDRDYEEKIEDEYQDVDIQNISSQLPSLFNQKVEIVGLYKPYDSNAQNRALFFDTDSSAAIEIDLTFCNYYVFGDGQRLTLFGILKNNFQLGTYIEVYYLRNNYGPIVKVPFRDP